MQSSGIEITQRLENGFLGGPKHTTLSIDLASEHFDIVIDQLGVRKTTITSNNLIETDELLHVFNTLDMLIMLGEGQFIPIAEGQVLVDGKYASVDDFSNLLSKRLMLYNSADYTIGNHSTFLSFDEFIRSSIFEKWIQILSELDILHNIVLYSMAATGMTVDCKCAFLVEAYEALAELIEKEVNTFKRPSIKNGESKLKKYLNAIISLYGSDIFSKEQKSNKDYIQVLVNSRNRVAHIKSKQGKEYLSGSESVLYSAKLSFLYRSILLSLLGVDYNQYSSELVKSISTWDDWNGVSDVFLSRI